MTIFDVCSSPPNQLCMLLVLLKLFFKLMLLNIVSANLPATHQMRLSTWPAAKSRNKKQNAQTFLLPMLTEVINIARNDKRKHTRPRPVFLEPRCPDSKFQFLRLTASPFLCSRQLLSTKVFKSMILRRVFLTYSLDLFFHGYTLISITGQPSIMYCKCLSWSCKAQTNQLFHHTNIEWLFASTARVRNNYTKMS